MKPELPFIAGTISTTIFALSTLPMLVKAYRTRDLSSHSLGNILLSNLGNLIHSVYVFSLPPGPIWLLHTFYLVTTALMLIWYLRYEWGPGVSRGLPDKGLKAEQDSQATVHHPMAVHELKYPVEIPRSGHVAASLFPYAGSEVSQSQVQ